jgi:hypothetical protein
MRDSMPENDKIIFGSFNDALATLLKQEGAK